VDERIDVVEAQQLGKGQPPTGAPSAVLATLSV
jgi:hypothetical protein